MGYLPQPRFYYMPEEFGAVGDAVTDDSQAIRDCIAQAQTDNKAVCLAPNDSYGVASTIDLSGSPVEIFGIHTKTVVNNPTIVKLANVHVFEANSGYFCLRNFSIKGRGNADPDTNDPAVESTPAIVAHERITIRDVQTQRLGGTIGSEPGTSGYSIGIYQLNNTGNPTYSRAENIVADSINGAGIYVGAAAGTTNINVNGIKASILNYIRGNNFAINNAHGFRNNYYVQHCGDGIGVFRFDYVENYGFCQYVEDGISVGCAFVSGGGNTAVFQDASGLTDRYTNLATNEFWDLKAGARFIGSQGAGHLARIEGKLRFVDNFEYPDGLGGYQDISP